MKKNNFFPFSRYLLFLFLCMAFVGVNAQALYIGDGGTFYLKAGTDFSTSNTLVTHHANGVFAVEAGFGSTWAASDTEHVDGTVTVLGAGITTAHTGNGSTYSAITVETAGVSDEIDCTYTKSDPASIGTTLNSTDFSATQVLSDTEYWTVNQITGTAKSVSTTPLAAAMYNGSAPTGTITFGQWNGTEWVSTTTLGAGSLDLAYASETAVTLDVETFDTNSFSVYPNPVKASTSVINYRVPANITSLDIAMYNVIGKQVAFIKNAPVNTGVNNITKPYLANGVYFMQFAINNGEQIISKKLIVK